MVSVVDEREALEAVRGGADIIDVKNPEEGALGAQPPQVIRRVKQVLPLRVELSATLGDLPYLPGTASLAAAGAAAIGVNYVKLGLFGVGDLDEAVRMVRLVKETLETLSFQVKLVACGYADGESFGGLNPVKLPAVAYKGGADGVLIDVKRKQAGINLFTYMDEGSLVKLAEESRGLGLFTAMAGGLTFKEALRCVRLGADVVGLRRGLLSAGRISSVLVARMADLLHVKP